ncbi:hypothetical protein Slin15195_G126030 [Septoria linicola]|uniref:Uncharacterized protein n=1 Tax=Septoria linicola TaxID=215465 RepID=A0A9Q9B1K5_9PEZI|nr:hypothetical protein Slin14017_G082210 [Septoria linicola]USW59284.1 hypothetical protein Slin15195_G126030 [Septoria linicola]
MAPKEASCATAATGDGPKLTENDLRVLALSWQCFRTMPSVDTAKLAELGGWKTPASANTAYFNARKKLLGDVKLPPAEKATPKKATKTASASDEGGETTGDDEETAAAVQTPAKKGRATPARKRKAASAAEGEEADETVETPKKKTKTSRKKKVEVKDTTAAEEEAAAAVEGGDEIAVKSEKVDDDAGDVVMKGVEEGVEGEVKPSIETADEGEAAGTV